MRKQSAFSAALIPCGILSIVGAVATAAYHRSIGFKGSTALEELGFLVGAVLVAAGIVVLVWPRGP